MNKSSNKPIIVQSVREMAPEGGVGRVAINLENQFQVKGYQCTRFTLDDFCKKRTHPTTNLYLKKLLLLYDVILYSFKGTQRLRKSFLNNTQVITLGHGDALYGDIFVMHGLHKAMIMKNRINWLMLLRNPLHVFLLIRESIRYRFNIHKRIVVFSESEKQNILKYYKINPEKIVIIPNGVDIVKFSPNLNNRLLMRQELGLNEHDFVVVFVGHEIERKGLQFLIPAINLLNQSELKVHLLIAGNIDPGRIPERIAGSKEYIHFLGLRRDIEKIYQSVDLFVLPSSFEAWPLVGLEAMASGLPVLMTNVNSIGEFLKDGENGYFIQRDPEDIAAKITKIINDQEKRRQMTMYARETAQQYSWTRIADIYLKLIHEVWEEKRHRA